MRTERTETLETINNKFTKDEKDYDSSIGFNDDDVNCFYKL